MAVGREKQTVDPAPDMKAAVARSAAAAVAVLSEDVPRAVVLFGSAVDFLAAGGRGRPPNDIDLFLVGDWPPPRDLSGGPHFPLEIHRLRTAEAIEIATMLRYDARPVALARLYTDNVVRRHALRVIAACLLLGPAYRRFGIEQIEIGGREDPRDYARQKVLRGHDWWARLCAWSRERRGPLLRWSDRLVGADRFGE